jgi:hypothetical protein
LVVARWSRRFPSRASALRRRTVQGKPVARRGRKARGLPTGDGPAAGLKDETVVSEREPHVKAILARFTMAAMLLASMALTLGAGVRWY